jgi:hypothetical protein
MTSIICLGRAINRMLISYLIEEDRFTFHLHKMFHFLVCIGLIFVHVSGQTTEESLQFSTGFDATQSAMTEQPLEMTTDSAVTQTWEQWTTDGGNLTTVDETEQMLNTTVAEQTTTSTMATTSSSPCPPTLNREILDEIKKEIYDAVLLAMTNASTSQLEAMEARLSALIHSNDEPKTPVVLDGQIYENLQIQLYGWTRVFDQPYSHNTRSDDLNQIAGICHNQVLVAATFNGSISLAAVGPASVLTLNTAWNRPQQLGQVYWYRTPGKSFGFSPVDTIRQTTADNEDLNSPLRLSWLLDQNFGGYRAGAVRSLADSSLWHKVIYCN